VVYSSTFDVNLVGLGEITHFPPASDLFPWAWSPGRWHRL